MSVPRYLYVPLGAQVALEVIARLTPNSLSVLIGLMIVTLCLCVYVGARGVLAGRPVLASALWSLPLTLLGFVNGSLGFAFEATGYDRSAYLTFVFASIIPCIAGIVAGGVGAVGTRAVRRTRSSAT